MTRSPEVTPPLASAAQAPPPALPPDSALFLDVDGCLLPFAPRPDAVEVPAALLARLEGLQRSLDGALALVSGRNLATLDQLFAPVVFAAAGLHGVERRHAGQAGCGGVVPPALLRARDAAIALIDAHPGALVEDKGTALGLHWRMVAPERQAAAELALHAFAVGALAGLPDYQLQPGDHVIELRPRHADKGSAILAFLEEAPFAGRVPVFAGDDLTDEPGFRAVNAHGGISVLVGNRAGSAARFRLPDPAAIHAWLGVPAGDPNPEMSR
jgi:trehalose 6-phosphate phosphatase